MAAPISITCPDIDRFIDNIKDAQNIIEGFESELEHLRDCNSQLREWGEEQENRAEEAEEAFQEACDRINELEEQIEELKLENKKMYE